MKHELLTEIATAVADGSVVDWPRLEAASDADARAIMRRLRLVEQIASVHSSVPVAAFERSLHDSMHRSAVPAATDAVPQTWGPLAIVKRIGRGTYADVYLAHDPRLDRPVALKLLRHRDTDVESEAIDEARLLARVRHPNVITVYGADRVDGRAGIWMELVDGRTLEQELAERGPLPASEIASIGIALCGALGAVHAAGLLHRDIKCQNAMRDRDGRILLTDFGTTREVSRAAHGEMAGTPLYLAPEVMNGQPASAASDIYSLGVLLYRLATRAFPLNGRSIADLRDAFSSDRRVPIRERRRDLPRRLARVVERAIDPVPARRYESATSMRAALAGAGRRRRVIVWTAAASLAVATVLGMAARSRVSDGHAAPRAVLVAAFDNESGDHRLDDVVAFAVEQELTQSQTLTVVPRERVEDSLRLMNLAATTRLDERTTREVGLRDGAIPLFVTGRIDRLTGGFSIHAAINRTSTADVVVEAGVDVAGIDGVLLAVRTLATTLRKAVGDDARQVDAEARLEHVTTRSLDALRAYTTGKSLIDERNWPAAELQLMEAVRIDPAFPSALIMLAHSRRNQDERSTGAYLPEAERAVRLSAGLPSRERYFIEGSYAQMIGDEHRAVAAYEALLREHPDDYWALNNLLRAYTLDGRMGELPPLFDRLALLRPNDFNGLVPIATALLALGVDLQTVGQIAEQASRLDPPAGTPADVYTAWLHLFPIFRAWAEGRIAETATALDALERTPPADDWHAFGRGQLNLSLGRVRAAERAFQSMSEPNERDALLAYAALARGDTTGAETALRRVLPALIQSPPGRALGYHGQTEAICWSLLQTGMVDGCRQFSDRLNYYVDRSHWIVGELAAADGNDAVALPILQNRRKLTPPGASTFFMGVETLAGIFDRRGDRLSAMNTLRWSDNTQRTLYPNSGSVGFFWLLVREHLLKLERQLGNTERADVIERDLRRLLVASDADFVLRRAIN